LFSPVLVYADIVEVDEEYSVQSEDSSGEVSEEEAAEEDDEATVGDED
jgi:hypothetical protein